MIPLAKGITIHCGNKRFVGEIPEIYVEKYAPLRDPLELIVKGYHISLRVEEAAHIAVENVR